MADQARKRAGSPQVPMSLYSITSSQSEESKMASSNVQSKLEKLSEGEVELEWRQINTILSKHGFSPIELYTDEEGSEAPDLTSLSEVLLDLLADYSAKKRDLKDYEGEATQLRACNQQLSRENKKLAKDSDNSDLNGVDQHNRELMDKLHRMNQNCRGKALVIRQLKEQLNLKHTHRTRGAEQREKNIFRAFMHRDYSPTRDIDSQVLGVIILYEEQREKLLEQLKVLRQSQKDTHAREGTLLNEIAQLVGVKSARKLPAAIQKLQEVVKALPNVEKFIQIICEITEIKNHHPTLDHVIYTVQMYKQRASKKDAGTGEGAKHFCHLFEADETDFKAAVQQVYYFVHEMKVFLSVRAI